MRGGTQAHRFLCNDGHQYVVKFQNNPLGKRVLVNEWIGAKLLHAFDLRAAHAAIVNLPPPAADGCTIEGLTDSVAPAEGLCFGSRCPANPETTALYDLLPDCLLETINRKDFLGALVFDQWLGHVDRRQAVFHRDVTTRRLVATLIDNSHILGASTWSLPDAPSLASLYHRSVVYRDLLRLGHLDEWIERVADFSPDQLYLVFASVPQDWISEPDRHEYERLFEVLVARRHRVQDWVRVIVRQFAEL